MPKEEYRCRRCNAKIQGNSELCVGCYWYLVVPCSACTKGRGKGGWLTIAKKRGKPVDCKACNNERFILRDYEPGEAREER